MRRFILWIRKYVLGIDDRSQVEIAVENGLILGENVHIMGECIMDPGHCWLIRIGNNVTIAPRVHILAHDASTKCELGYTMLGKVSIGNDVFVGANTVILPGVAIGNKVVIGANSVVTKNIPDNSVAAGNPARVMKTYEAYMQEKRDLMKRSPVFNEDYVIGNITNEKKEEMKQKLENKTGFIV